MCIVHMLIERAMSAKGPSACLALGPVAVLIHMARSAQNLVRVLSESGGPLGTTPQDWELRGLP